MSAFGLQINLQPKTHGYRLVDEITYKQAGDATQLATSSAILGPFFRHDAPTRENGSTITFDTPKDGKVAFMHGIVKCAKTGQPLADTEVDVWQASTNGTSLILSPLTPSHSPSAPS